MLNEDGDINFDWDDLKQMVGKQGGQMLGMVLTLGYSSFAQHASEVYMGALEKNATPDALWNAEASDARGEEWNNLSYEDKVRNEAEYNVNNRGLQTTIKIDPEGLINDSDSKETQIEKEIIRIKNNHILDAIKDGRDKPDQAIAVGLAATGLDLAGTYFAGGAALKSLGGFGNLINKLMKDTWRNNATAFAKSGKYIGNMTGIEVGTEWTQDLLIKWVYKHLYMVMCGGHKLIG